MPSYISHAIMGEQLYNELNKDGDIIPKISGHGISYYSNQDINFEEIIADYASMRGGIGNDKKLFYVSISDITNTISEVQKEKLMAQSGLFNKGQ